MTQFITHHDYHTGAPISINWEKVIYTKHVNDADGLMIFFSNNDYVTVKNATLLAGQEEPFYAFSLNWTKKVN